MTFQLLNIVMEIAVFLFAISVHESAHAWMANRCGDPTARMLGRVTLNPIKHIDPLGTVLLPLLAIISHLPVIGWAKPTPVDPRNFKHPVRDDILTSVAGPVSNFIVAAGAVLLMLAIGFVSTDGRLVVRAISDGYIVDTGSVLMPLTLLLYNLMVINVLLGVFNLIPLPPLDGSHVLRHLLPDDLRRAYDMAGTFGFILLFLLGGRVIAAVTNPIIGVFRSILQSV
jgi:Zn-dependent protease